MRVQKAIEIKATPKKTWLNFGEPGKVLQWYRAFREVETPLEALAGSGGSAAR